MIILFRQIIEKLLSRKPEKTVETVNAIDDLFSMFHDFEIVGLKLENQILTMETSIPWNEIRNIEDYKMTFRFEGCTSLKCQYFKRTSDDREEWKKTGSYPSKEHFTSDPIEIKKLRLEVQRHDFIKPEKFILHCNSSSPHDSLIGVIEGGKIELTATDYSIFDNEMKEVTLTEMKDWATKWWNTIQKTWDKKGE